MSTTHIDANFKKMLEKLGFADLVDEIRLLTYNQDYDSIKNLKFDQVYQNV